MSTLRHGKENHKFIVLREKEFDFLRRVLADIEGNFFPAEPWCPARMVVSLDDWDLEPGEVAAFYGILRAVNRAMKRR